MSLEDEAQRLEQTMLGSARKITDAGELRQILRQCLGAYEKAVEALPCEDREEALCLYLDRIRKVTFSFHVAILRRNVRKQFGERPSRKIIGPLTDQYSRQMRDVAKAYKFV